jgi:hypothetical protein
VICALGLVVAAGASAAVPNGYTEVTQTYSIAGCTTWQVPGGLAGDVTVTAMGAAGQAGVTPETGYGLGGAGDEVQATITGFESPSQSLYVCVDVGGGAGGSTDTTEAGGNGGGASGVSYGTDFDKPYVVAAGGGGGGGGLFSAAGGGAGQNGGTGGAGGGTGATSSALGQGGPGHQCNDGSSGGQFGASGPGAGGLGGAGGATVGQCPGGGGGGGGGYYGGGGGGADVEAAGGGGGGGSDFCSGEGTYGISVNVTCSTTAGAGTGTTAGTASGDAEVVLQYLVFTGFTTSISTTVDDATTNAAWSSNGEPGSDGAYDTATLTGAPYHSFAVDGTVTYDLYDNGACSGETPATTQTVSVTSTGSVPNSSSTGALSPGNYSFQATYNGGTDYAASQPSACEPFTVTKAMPSIATTQQPASANVGSQVADKATVSGGSSPTGTVTFNLYNNANATGTPLFSDTETLSGGVATSKSYKATAAGTDYWVATYNGDTNNAAVTSATGAEPVTINAMTSLKAAPQLVLFEPFVGIGNQVVQATLTAAGVPVVGQTVYFSEGLIQLCHATTNTKGVARCTISILSQALVTRNNQYTASFTAAAGYTGSASTVPAITFFWS